ncbi:hypothetical protein C770_GR4pC0150 (plasmid) [Sinorhizobium meliloti GR4]|nr:hypothetical protein C770_GR4pC0150 [Sinorhizobium meliloti GR4]
MQAALKRPADRLPGFLVNDEDIRLRMVDLNDLQRPGGGKHPSNRLCLLRDLVFAAPFGALLQVDLFESSIDRSAMRRLEAGRDAVRLHIPDQLRNGRTAAEVEYRAWTDDGKLRHASFKGSGSGRMMWRFTLQ